ncbi:MAG TPA: ClpXP protease specificity-enhancing factor SspB [Leptospiraceae bacterium]|nr:ClpXP protease specificity-enhancing factor SspB [Leptospiraceae bacterium]HMW03885.1 ClpXP protease specificity-enhancing factor SspB [Leptospiraceae bacterium]HMX32401.1 ClpXP protease specificity-enhancing factor SspB [Leptospiraceae bacterium]HMY29865.1 ClpXP protease specificity-enhancing factor SspB [Leptospiraceae bacterium]HMZ62991.1 ClpXP protease specificity-enhancing factor SspB [Leptospiraceae bacterium]
MEQDLTETEIRTLRDFKIQLFETYWEKFPTFYLHVLPHPNLEMGKRGLVGAEKESGVVLAFGSTAVRDISSQADYLYAELQFGFNWEKLIIPWDAVFRIYDKGQNSITQLRILTDEIDFSNSESKTKKVEKKKETPSESKVIEVDFTARKKE